MITCAECRQRLYPDDPRARTGRYNLCSCEYCDKPEIYRQLENQPVPERVIVHRHSNMSKGDWDLLQQTARRVQYLEKEIVELKARKRGQDYEPF